MNNNEHQKKPPINFEVTVEMREAVEKLRAMNYMTVAAYMRKLIREDAIKNNIPFSSIDDQPSD